MSIQSQGENLRNAVKYISEERKCNPQKALQVIIDAASAKYDLSPKDAEFLMRHICQEK